MIQKKEIDGGRSFDWGRTSKDYAKYRDIYPQEFYQKLLDHKIGLKGQNILDIGTGTGVLPRGLYPYGARFTGIDISEGQIRMAKELAAVQNMDISFQCTPAEEIPFEEHSFDAVTACQCFTYFDHTVLSEKISRVLKDNGRFAVLYMAWLPMEDEIAGKSEELVLKYHPLWNGCRETRHKIQIPEVYKKYFEIEAEEVFDLSVPFTREGWNGRMKACRGIGASLPEEQVAAFEKEHLKLLEQTAPQEFQVLHYAAVSFLRKQD
ncbi:class I SAM-dependent methyltransferase [Anaerostipes sp.]|uniref:class I SAM-dependent methyltransferase n=1 Tax=Anaerostipes sp. TaxID=1872530 RepID=UPI0025C54233|nr:class I SAM-dependent methyltransferase [Anaerostipes sp.]MBS7008765.1 methyltransferase domain-containing protein [Anaerostipes sp.]